jgi:hypothetical protein
MTELEELKKRVAELEKAAKPPEPFVREPWQPIDYTANARMSRSAMQSMIDAVPSSVLSEEVTSFNAYTRSSSQPQPTSKVQRGSGWVNERPIEPPPGIELCDRLMDHQDAIDKVELARKIASSEDE